MGNEKLAVVNVRQAGSVITQDVVDAIFRRRRYWIPALAVWALLVALYASLSPRRFEAETVLLVKNSRPSLGLTADEHYQPEQKESQIATELELLSQQDLLRAVAQRTGAPNSGAGLDEAVKKLRSDLEITPVFKADLIRIQYVSTDRSRAMKVLSALLNVYMDRHLELHHRGDAYPFFDQQAEAAAKDLKAAEDKLAVFEKRTGIVLLNDQKEAAVSSIADLEAKSRAAASTLYEAQRQQDVLSRRKGELQPRITTQTRSIPNQYSVERMNTLLTELRNKRTELMTKFLPGNRLVLEVDEQIANTQASLSQARAITSREEATDVNPLHQAIDRELASAEVNAATARIRREVVDRQIRQQQQEIAKLDSYTTEHDTLLRDVKLLEDNYKLYSGRREEARISDALDQQRIANVAVAEAPMVPHLAKPRVTGGLAGVFLLGCAVIFSVTFIIGGRRKTFETPWELEALTVVPVLATLSHSSVAPLGQIWTQVSGSSRNSIL